MHARTQPRIADQLLGSREAANVADSRQHGKRVDQAKTWELDKKDGAFILGGDAG